ncbi:MAG: hypothetical protein LBB34_00790 [Holosporales bacterium]|nr:hypothetical protein [Holosporales bacterium]
MSIKFKLLLSICAIASFSSQDALGGLFSGVGSAFSNAKKKAIETKERAVNTATKATTVAQGVVTKADSKVQQTVNTVNKKIQTVNTKIAGSITDGESRDEGFMLSGHWYSLRNKKIDEIFEKMPNPQDTKMIDLRGHALTDEDMLYIAVCLEEFGKTGAEKYTLHFGNNELTASGVSILMECLQACPKLSSILDISGNQIGDDGAAILADNIHNLAINFLVLSNTRITGDGMLILLSAITKMGDTVLQMLNFSENNITNGYWDLIVQHVSQFNEGFMRDGIDLSGNQLTLLPGTVIPTPIRL